MPFIEFTLEHEKERNRIRDVFVGCSTRHCFLFHPVHPCFLSHSPEDMDGSLEMADWTMAIAAPKLAVRR